LCHILAEEGVLRYFPTATPPPLDRVRRLVLGQLEHWDEHGYGWWAVEPRARAKGHAPEEPDTHDEPLIGWAGLTYLPETDETEVAYLLGKPFWGRGLATEAAQASLRYGFEDLEIEVIVGIVHPDHLASQRVLAKAGLSFVERAHYFGMDVLRYAVERSAWVPSGNSQSSSPHGGTG
jgi:RimJ/RimL family protein N-acetyltransferase